MGLLLLCKRGMCTVYWAHNPRGKVDCLLNNNTIDKQNNVTIRINEKKNLTNLSSPIVLQ